ncbi:histidine--tRNA ligase [Candidatus Magnetomonas plexicatena]|uniref:histidine--tRNA ligase n=1 Tax=Candidatus Magnetomonas plexicatena TaxID=2552947 RepID=UPI001C73E8DD|nr:histidine--tRNA ligase [Nitrospirales bacterium LBB_01]
MTKLSTLKGVCDVLPPEIYTWNRIEETSKEVFKSFGFHEVKIPVIEHSELFIRSIGETTDIVGKEMYTFMDKGGRSITLRPEGTAGMVRSYVENNLHLLPSPQKFHYYGPMFRYERPQKGRLRQFYQIGVEALGSASPLVDAEVITMAHTFFQKLNLTNLTIELNSIGCNKCRGTYRNAIVEFFSKKGVLCNDCQVRIAKNPLRMLDCKVERCVEQRTGAPVILDYICEECKTHHERLKELLTAINIDYKENPHIVRGLDYYNRTAFEITTEHLGAQKAVAAGGRYDNLVSDFNGPATPAVGFAIGIERLVALVGVTQNQNNPVFYIAPLGKDAEDKAFVLSQSLRQRAIVTECGDGLHSLKNHLKRADKLNASFVVIIGENELKTSQVLCKRLSDAFQKEIGIDDIDTLIAFAAEKPGATA